MKFFDIGQEATGFIAIGQQATGVFALGQIATGFIAIGQLARGVVAIGQVSFGVVSVGMLSVGLAHCTAMLGLGGLSGKGFVWRFIPKLAPKVLAPTTTTLDAIRSTGREGFVDVSVLSNGEDVRFEKNGHVLPIDVVTGLRSAARSLAEYPRPEAFALVAPVAGGRFVCDRLVRRRDARDYPNPSVGVVILGAATLIAGSYLYWLLFMIPWLQTLLTAKV